VTRMHADEVVVDEELVGRLLAAQLPALAHLPLRRVEPWGTDHGIWRLGDDLVIRLPRIGWARHQVAFEARWLPQLAPHLPVELPEPVAAGEPMFGYPFQWAVHRWLPGKGASPASIADPHQFARDLADVVRQLQRVPTTGAPRVAQPRPPATQQYDVDTREVIAGAAHLIVADAATAVWEAALAAPPWPHEHVWVHGDLEGNCLVRDGRLSGLVDWGSACAGDPAVDVQVIWSPLFTPESRATFLDELQVDDATVARSRGAAIQQACAALPYYLHTYPLIVERSWHKLAALGVERRSGPVEAG
jgi:aminoglycoside phosphotransferase (APT) family kinase protein